MNPRKSLGVLFFFIRVEGFNNPPDRRPLTFGSMFAAGLLILMFVPAALFSQTAGETMAGETRLPRGAYLIPQTIYVGDKGRLVVPLGEGFDEVPAFVRETPGELSSLPDLVISRIELEKRNNVNRLLVDFISYAPGTVTLPPVTLPPGNSPDPLVVDGIEIVVASILTPDLMTLSPPALPLSAPGTGLFVYGGLGLAVFILILGGAAFISFRRFFEPLRKRYRQRKLLASLEQKILVLRGNDPLDDPARSEIFSLLAGEFRGFLSFITGTNCGTLSPAEFAGLPLTILGAPEAGFFCRLFRRWDELRFSGVPLKQDDVLEVCDKITAFLGDLNKTGKNL